ncbi:MAG: DUF4405 domain-containing protein [Pirellulales bacterium]|nr:DUF4405 domain-containing protein [Pirellulales bacterium]
MAQKFSKTDVNFVLDALLLAAFMVLCWASVVVRYVFPPGPKAEGWTLWGGDYLVWSDIQFGSLCVLAMGVLVHVMLHWSWVCGVVASRTSSKKKGAGKAANRDDGSRTLWGVGLLIVVFNIIGLGVAAAALTITGPGGGG